MTGYSFYYTHLVTPLTQKKVLAGGECTVVTNDYLFSIDLKNQITYKSNKLAIPLSDNNLKTKTPKRTGHNDLLLFIA